MTPPIDPGSVKQGHWDLHHAISYILTGDDYFTSSKCKTEVNKLVALFTQELEKARTKDDA